MILQSTLLKPYYRQNVGFYLLVYLLAFGFMRGTEHVQISSLIMARIELLAMVSVLWTLHVVKTALFVHRLLTLPTHSFLRDFAFKKPLEQWEEYTMLQFYLNLPFLTYGVFMIIIGILNANYLSVLVLIIIILGLIAVPVFWLNWRFSNFLKVEKTTFSTTWSLWPKSSYFWFLRYLLAREPFLFFSTKSFSFLIILGLSTLYATDDYDYRLIYLAVFFAGLGQFVIGKSYQQYLNEDLKFTRNIPFSRQQIIANISINALLMCFFEILVVFRYLPLDLAFYDGLKASFLIFAIQFFWLAIGYLPKSYGETFSKRLYLLAAIFMLLIMYHVPVFVLGGFLIFFGMFCSIKYFDEFEPS